MIEFKEGKIKGLKFGTYTFRIINELMGKDTPIEEVFKSLEKTDGSLLDKFEFLNKFCYACAKHYSLSKKLEVDFSEIDVADWIDEIGIVTAQSYMNELLKVYAGNATKNMEALETGQPASTSGPHLPSSN
jgi:hypothetical protein